MQKLSNCNKAGEFNACWLLISEKGICICNMYGQFMNCPYRLYAEIDF